MGMRVQGGSYSAAEQMQWQQRRQNFDTLSKAITGGDLSAAKDAFAKVKGQISNGDSVNPDSFLGKIGAALQSGDLTSAQQLLASRQNKQGNQTSAADAQPSADAANAAVIADGAAVASSTSSATGRHHHHHGGGGSPALDLSQAIQSGDTSKAQSSMQTIIADLQQMASLAPPAGSASGAASSGSVSSQAASAATKLLQNPDFQALEDAVAKGDAAGMKSAWNNLIGGSSSGASSSAAQQQVAA